jgi:peptidoglycan/LPS O-acetylase OafA/YrhL
MGSNNAQAQKRLPAVDGLRGLAAMGVLLFHTLIWKNGGFIWKGGWHNFSIGAAGLDLFLVLSGFCLTWRLLLPNGKIDKLPIKKYWKRRMIRIVPPYYAALIIAISAAYLTSVWHVPNPNQVAPQDLFPFRASTFIPSLVTHITFTHGFFPQYAHHIDGTYWTLSLEEQFYCLFPLLILVARKWGAGKATIIILLIPAVWWTANFCGWHYPQTTSGGEICFARWFEFGLGMYVAVLVARGQKMRPLFCIVLLVFAGFIDYNNDLFTFLGWHRDYVLLKNAAWAVAFSTLVFQATQRGLIAQCLSSKPMAALGQISYSLYLTHGPILMLVCTFVSRHPQASNIAYALAPVLAIVFAIPFHFAFERPFMSRPKKQPLFQRKLAMKDSYYTELQNGATIFESNLNAASLPPPFHK